MKLICKYGIGKKYKLCFNLSAPCYKFVVKNLKFMFMNKEYWSVIRFLVYGDNGPLKQMHTIGFHNLNMVDGLTQNDLWDSSCEDIT